MRKSARKEGFYYTEMISKYGFKPRHFDIIDALFRGVCRDMSVYNFDNETLLFEINKSYMVSYLVGYSERSFSDALREICAIRNGLEPVIYAVRQVISKGDRAITVKMRYKFNPLVLKKLVDFTQLPKNYLPKAELLTASLLPDGVTPNGDPNKKLDYDTNAMAMVLNIIKSVQVKDGKTGRLFANKIAKDGNYSKELINASRKVEAIYNGTFSKVYRVSGEYPSTSGQWERITNVAGDWKKVRLLLKNTAERYYRLEKDNGLIHCISKWLYNDLEAISLFVTSIPTKGGDY